MTWMVCCQICVVFFLVTSMVVATALAGQVDDEFPREYTDCGGTVTISDTANTVIEYKTVGVHGVNERCIWTILPEPNRTLTDIVMFVERQSFGAADGLVFHPWSGTVNGLTYTRIATSDTGNTRHFAGPRGFLYFSSDSSPSDDGLGFRVVLVGVYATGPSTVKHEAWTFEPETCSINFFYPPWPAVLYESSSLFSIVLQQNKNVVPSTNLSIADVETASSIVLEVYKLGTYSSPSPTREASYGGQQCPGVCGETTSPEPRLILFSSTQTTATGRGFQGTWSFNP